MATVQEEAREFILKNNLFNYTGDDFSKYTNPGINGISTWGIPNAEVNVKKVKGNTSIMYPGEVVFEAKYCFDEYGRRATVHTSEQSTRTAIFFGDSMTFGEGLNDDETFPYYFEKFNKDYCSYNYGFLGHGPSHMLLHLQSKEFKQQFQDKQGKVFYLYRDDAIKVSVGQAPWGEGFPKFILNGGTLEYQGKFETDNHQPQEMYLPSEYTDNDYRLTLSVFKQCKEQVNKVSKDLTFHIVTLPISFTSDKIEKLLKNESIDIINLSLTDVEYYTDIQARFLDGIHTSKANKLLAKKTSYYLDAPLTTNRLPDTPYTDIKVGIQRIKERCFLMPSMVDFPYDDAGVIISLILQDYIGPEYSKVDFLDIAKTAFNSKLKIVGKLTENITEQKTIEIVDSISKSSYFIKILYEEYINTLKIINKIYE